MSTTEPAPDAPYLWRVLRHYIEQTCILFGMPGALAQKLFLTRAEHKRVCAWLRPLEHLLRRLIFLEALGLEPAPLVAIEHKSRARRITPAATGAHFDPDNSETWRATFNLNAPTLRQAQRGFVVHNACRSLSKTSSAPIINVVSSAPVALRIEALIRGFNDPSALAQRLANTLVRTPAIVDEILSAPARRVAALPGYHSVIQAVRLVREAWRAKAIADSS